MPALCCVRCLAGDQQSIPWCPWAGDTASHSPSCLFIVYRRSPIFLLFPKLFHFSAKHFVCISQQSGSIKTSGAAPVFWGRTRAKKELLNSVQQLGCRNGFLPMTVTLLQSEDGDTLALRWPQPRSGLGMLFLSTCAVFTSSSSAGTLGLGTCRTQPAGDAA